jgi:hypothetical protein
MTTTPSPKRSTTRCATRTCTPSTTCYEERGHSGPGISGANRFTPRIITLYVSGPGHLMPSRERSNWISRTIFGGVGQPRRRKAAL